MFHADKRDNGCTGGLKTDRNLLVYCLLIHAKTIQTGAVQSIRLMRKSTVRHVFATQKKGISGFSFFTFQNITRCAFSLFLIIKNDKWPNSGPRKC